MVFFPSPNPAYDLIAAPFKKGLQFPNQRRFNALWRDGQISKGALRAASDAKTGALRAVSLYAGTLNPNHLRTAEGSDLIHFTILSCRKEIIATEEDARLFYPSITVKPSRNLERQAHALYLSLRKNATINPDKMKFEVFARGLRIAVRNYQIENGFSNTVPVTPDMLARVFTGEIFKRTENQYAPIYQREKVADLDDARVWIERYLMAAEHLLPMETLDVDSAPRYFLVGCPGDPIAALRVTPRQSNFPFAAFPDFKLEKGSFYYVQLVYDNLAGIQFRVLDKNGKIVKKYAYDASVPEKFSLYTYAEEEKRQFDLYNRHMITEAGRERQAIGLSMLRHLACILSGIKPDSTCSVLLPSLKDDTAAFRFYLAGPARRLTLRLPGDKYTTFSFLNIEPRTVYEVEVGMSRMPGESYWDKEGVLHLPPMTPTVTFKPVAGQGEHSRTFYFSRAHSSFVQIFARKIDDKSRVSVPEPFTPKPWDDEFVDHRQDFGIIL